MDVFLDIGFTLVSGPLPSPPKKIAEILNLGDSDREIVANTVFCEPHYTVDTFLVALQRNLGMHFTEMQISDVTSVWDNQFKSAYELEGASDLLTSIVEAGIGLNIVSNIWYPFYHNFLQIFPGIDSYIKTRTLSFEERVKKPSPEFFERAVKRAAADLGTSVVLGDSLLEDIAPCAKLGMRCIYFQSRPAGTTDADLLSAIFSDRKDTLVVETLGDARKALMEIYSHEQRRNTY